MRPKFEPKFSFPFFGHAEKKFETDPVGFYEYFSTENKFIKKKFRLYNADTVCFFFFYSEFYTVL